MVFVDDSVELDTAECVIMNRVICCYHDMPSLAGAAADRTRELLVMSYPKRAWWTTIGLGLANMVLRATRREFHIFLHPPGAIIATSKRHGLHPVLDKAGVLGTGAALERSR